MQSKISKHVTRILTTPGSWKRHLQAEMYCCWSPCLLLAKKEEMPIKMPSMRQWPPAWRRLSIHPLSAAAMMPVNHMKKRIINIRKTIFFPQDWNMCFCAMPNMQKLWYPHSKRRQMPMAYCQTIWGMDVWPIYPERTVLKRQHLLQQGLEKTIRSIISPGRRPIR